MQFIFSLIYSLIWTWLTNIAKQKNRVKEKIFKFILILKIALTIALNYIEYKVKA